MKRRPDRSIVRSPGEPKFHYTGAEGRTLCNVAIREGWMDVRGVPPHGLWCKRCLEIATPARATGKRHAPAPRPDDPYTCAACERPLARGSNGRVSHMRQKRQRAEVDAFDYSKFAGRIVSAMGKRVGAGDIAALPDLVALRDELDASILDAVATLRSEPHNYSWQQIADVLGVTRQAAQQRYGKAEATNPRKRGGQPAHLR